MASVQTIYGRPRGSGACSPGPRAFDALFDDLLRGFGVQAPAREAAGRSFSPPLDVWETPTEIRVQAELPGVCDEDVAVTLEEELLLLEGRKRVDPGPAGSARRHAERVGGEFRRRLRLPCDVDAEGVTARYRDGVLTVVLPKAANAAPRDIPVRTR